MENGGKHETGRKQEGNAEETRRDGGKRGAASPRAVSAPPPSSPDRYEHPYLFLLLTPPWLHAQQHQHQQEAGRWEAAGKSRCPGRHVGGCSAKSDSSGAHSCANGDIREEGD